MPRLGIALALAVVVWASLRAAVGTKLDLGLVRAPGAPATGATLSFRFR